MKSKIPFFFFCLVIIAGLWILVRPALRQRNVQFDSSQPSSISITLTDTKANELLQTYLPDELPARDVRVAFSADGISLSGTVNPSAVIDPQAEARCPELAVVRRLLPDSVALSARFSVAAGNGSLSIQPAAFSLGGYAIPLGFLPQSLKSAIGNMLAEQLQKTGFTLTGVELASGQITIHAK